MALKRVVVTGLGALTPIGNNLNDFWTGLIEGKSGAAPITYFDTEKFKTKFACELKDFDVSLHLDRKQQRKMDRFTQYGMVSTEEAIQDSGLDLEKIDKIVAAARNIEGCSVLGVEPDADYNRTVITIAGSPKPVIEAAYNLIKSSIVPILSL